VKVSRIGSRELRLFGGLARSRDCALGLWALASLARGVHLASGLFVVAAVLKVFLYDLAQLEGILRALSFIGLGAVLIGIGLAYQKLVFHRSM
jgi:uncharacterized membrane protein